MKPPKIRKWFERERSALVTEGESRTHQSFADECDINTIMRKFEKTGVIAHQNVYGGRYGDFTGADDYQDACNQVLLAEQMFQTVPSKIRKRFNNDPAEFLAFVQDPQNEDEMREMGLLRAKQNDGSTDPSPTPPPAPSQAPERGKTQPPGASPSKSENTSPKAP